MDIKKRLRIVNAKLKIQDLEDPDRAILNKEKVTLEKIEWLISSMSDREKLDAIKNPGGSELIMELAKMMLNPGLYDGNIIIEYLRSLKDLKGSSKEFLGDVLIDS